MPDAADYYAAMFTLMLLRLCHAAMMPLPPPLRAAAIFDAAAAIFSLLPRYATLLPLILPHAVLP